MALPMTKHPTYGCFQGEQLDSIDLFQEIFLLNRTYLDFNLYTDPHEARINCLYYSQTDGRLYIIFANSYILFSEDNLASLNEVAEINYDAGGLISRDKQFIDAVVGTMDGSVLFAGRDRRTSNSEAGIVWRKSLGCSSFTRHVVVTNPAWKTSMSGNMTSGYFGDEHRKMVALAIYAPTNAHFFYSFDDGLSWKKQEMSKQFKNHVHEVYLPSSIGANRKARLWMTGGDDTTGEKSGLLYIDSKSFGGLGSRVGCFESNQAIAS